MDASRRTGTRAGRLRLAWLVLSVALLLAAASRFPTGYLAVYPGPVRSLEGVVKVQGRPAPATSFRMVAVVAQDASVLGFVRAALDPSGDLWSKAGIYGGRTPEQYAYDSRALMAASQATAASAAFASCGFDLGGDDLPPLPYSIQSGEVAGPSAGLAFALEMVAWISGEDLARGRSIVATGVLDSGGAVAPVGGIAQKAVACREGGVEILIVPEANAAEAARNAGALRVVGVSSLAEALAFLRAP